KLTGLVTAAGGLDLEHLGPQIAETLGRERTGENPRQIDDPEPLQRPCPRRIFTHVKGSTNEVPARAGTPFLDDPCLGRWLPACAGISKGDAAEYHRAAVTMISTSTSGRARSALTQARAGGFCGSTHSFHTAFMAPNIAM